MSVLAFSFAKVVVSHAAGSRQLTANSSQIGIRIRAVSCLLSAVRSLVCCLLSAVRFLEPLVRRTVPLGATGFADGNGTPLPFELPAQGIDAGAIRLAPAVLARRATVAPVAEKDVSHRKELLALGSRLSALGAGPHPGNLRPRPAVSRGSRRNRGTSDRRPDLPRLSLIHI